MQSYNFKSFHGGATTRILAVALVVIALLGSSVAQQQGLARVGPVDSSNGFPQWYQDKTGLALDLCLPDAAELASGICFILPGTINLPIVFPTNYPPEAFYFAADSVMNVNGGQARVTIGHEGGFSTIAGAIPGNQIVFARVRIRIDIPAPGGSYKVITPYMEKTFNALPGKRGINFTEDIGLVPGDFTVALNGRIGPYLRPSLTPGGAPLGFSIINGKSYISDAATPFPVTGSPLGIDHNVFRIEGPNIGGPGVNFIQTTLFTLMGRVHTAPIPSPLAIDRATYVRDAQKGWIDVFTTATPGVGKPTPVLSVAAG
ncbi:MAG TPA: hypothetical protein VFP40_04930, partial [Terriglobales bacterium]|nr:hypothetical protein [Terriglobales bacterium]